MKKNILFLLITITTSIFSQQKYAKEFSFVNDNDLYTSINRDRYYTNGMFLNYRYLGKNNSSIIEKQIFEFQLGHHMYTPYKALVYNINEHDRPFAGYLFGSFGINRAYKNNTIFKTSIQLGIVGPSAFGKELQKVIHDMYGFEEAIGWEHQIKDAIGINFQADYNKHLVADSSNHFDITWINNAKFGSIYTDITTGFYTRLSFEPLQKIINSIAFNTAINNESTSFVRAVESFFFIKPFITYAFYDATLQGSIFTDNNPVTGEIVNLRYGFEIGYKFTVNRFNFGYIVNYQTKKSEGLKYQSGNTYGTIQLNYLFN